VFRFGHALGRRFLRVPIPAADADKFRIALLGQDSGLPERCRRDRGDYSAHLMNSMTTLGPALFLRMADYIAAGVGTDAETLTGVGQVDRELLAEAYLVNVGTCCARWRTSCRRWAGRSSRSTTPRQSEWEWIVEMSRVLS